MQETRAWFPGWEASLEEEVATHSSMLAWVIPWTEEPDRLQSIEPQRVGQDWSDLACFASRSIFDLPLFLVESLESFILHFPSTNNISLKALTVLCTYPVINFFSTMQISSVQPLSRVRLCYTMDCSMPGSLSITTSQSLLTPVHRVGDAIQPSHPHHPLLLLPLIFPSIRVFSNESVLPIMWPKDWSFSFSISHSNEYSGLISFRIEWLDFLAVQGTLKSLL